MSLVPHPLLLTQPRSAMESPNPLPQDGITNQPQLSVPGKPKDDGLPKSITIDEIDNEVLRFVVECLEKGQTRREIKDTLLANDFEPKVADLILDAVMRYRRRSGDNISLPGT